MSSQVISIQTPLPESDVLFYHMDATDVLSRPYSYTIDFLSPRKDIALDDLLGKHVSVKVLCQAKSERYFGGHVVRLSHVGAMGRYQRYRALVRPWLWFLMRTADCRIFQGMTVPDIIQQVFTDHGTADVEMHLSAHYRTWNYCVQYRETDFNFISRLMEQEGIYYYFKHAAGRHTMMIVDSTSTHTPTAHYDTLSFVPPERVVRPDLERISSWEVTRQIQPTTWVQNDYDFERPNMQLLTKAKVSRNLGEAEFEIFDFPGEYLQSGDGEHYAKVRLDELETKFETASATTNARGMVVGSTFTLADHARADQNREFLLTATTHAIQYGEYEGLPAPEETFVRCEFEALSTRQQYRPERLAKKPAVQGPQTAIVVGPAGDEIYTDKYGRVKVQFPWDRYGKKNENSSCWMRVSHPWAGKNWGMIALPRIGQEVIVDFLEGDPDEPIITGRVYNADQMPPYALPENMTITTTKTRSSKGGTPANFNEIRFEDKKGSEQLFIHAEKNQDIEVEHDETHWVGHDRTKKIDHDERVNVGNNRTESVGVNESITIGKNRTETVGENETISIGKNRSEDVADNETVAVGKNQSLSVGADRTLSVAQSESTDIGDSRKESVANNEDVSIGKNRKHEIGENDGLHVGKKLTIQAGDQITISTGDASITLKKDGTITIKGNDITIEGGGKINVKASANLVLKGAQITQN